jgi:hypothetical protein
MIPQKPPEKQPTGEIVTARAWLEHFPVPRRSTIANWFHFAVRDGAHQPAVVLQAVRQVCARRLGGGDETDAAVVLQALDSDPEGAIAYAAAVIAYEQLPYEARQRVKAERAIHFIKETMRGKTVTPAQTAYLQLLGYAGAPPTDRAQAGALIDDLRQKRGQA